MPYKDLQKRKEYMKEYREKFNLIARKSYKKNKDEILSKLKSLRKDPLMRKKANARLKAWRNMVLGKCEICGNLATERHHENYNAPLKVNSLCGFCHADVHRGIKSVS